MVADHVCDPIDHLPDAGELVLTDRMHLTIGGCASNVAVDLAKLGIDLVPPDFLTLSVEASTGTVDTVSAFNWQELF